MKSASLKAADVDSGPMDSALEAILEVSENAFVIFDRSGNVRAANERVRRLLEFDDAEWAHVTDFTSFSRLLASHLAKSQPPFRPPWLLWQPGNGAGREQLTLAGGTRVLERLARPLGRNSDASLGWVERYRDLTAERQLPARLLQTYKLAALGQMTAGITHELNNPLTTIMGYSQLLLEQPLEAKVLAGVRRICQESERARRIIRSLLTLAREAKIERSPVNLNDVVERTLRLCGHELKKAGIAVDLDLDPELPPTLANPVQLQQVTLNLVVNAQQAIAEAGRPGRLALRTRHNASRVTLCVEDDGPGIPPELQNRIFEPFFTTKPVGVGTGLGLSIVSGILRQHGGEIHVSGRHGSGAVFTVELPLVRDPEHDSMRPADEESSRSLVSASRILVIEEEGGVGELTVDALRADGHQVELAADAADAVSRLENDGFDLVICDSKFSRLDALPLRRALGSSAAVRRGRLLLISSDPAGVAASNFLPERRYPCLLKPFLLAELKGAVARLLSPGEQPNGG